MCWVGWTEREVGKYYESAHTHTGRGRCVAIETAELVSVKAGRTPPDC